jgi:hypothetical protein
MPRGENLRGRRLPNAGRKQGSRNKLTQGIKEAIEGAFTELGGKDWLVKVAKSDPAVFCALLGKLLPKQLEHSGDLNHNIDFREQLEAARRRVREHRVSEQEQLVRPDFLKEAS